MSQKNTNNNSEWFNFDNRPIDSSDAIDSLNRINSHIHTILHSNNDFHFDSWEEAEKFGIENINGRGRLPMADGSYQEGYFQNGNLEGVGIESYGTGMKKQIRRWIYQKGVLVFAHEIKDATGQIRQGHIKPSSGDTLHGKWMYIDVQRKWEPKKDETIDDWEQTTEERGEFYNGKLIEGTRTNLKTGQIETIIDTREDKVLRSIDKALSWARRLRETVYSIYRKNPGFISEYQLNSIFEWNFDKKLENLYKKFKDWSLSLKDLQNQIHPIHSAVVWVLSVPINMNEVDFSILFGLTIQLSDILNIA